MCIGFVCCLITLAVREVCRYSVGYVLRFGIRPLSGLLPAWVGCGSLAKISLSL